MNSLILSAATRLATSLMLLLSLVLLARGHDAPGGGFIAGLVAAAGLVLYAIGHGLEQARASLRVPPGQLVAAGLLAALAAGGIGPLLGEAPFSGQWLELGLGGGRTLTLSSILLFDTGVYLVVLGTVLAVVFGLEAET